MMSWVMLMTDNVLAHISCPVVCASRQQSSVSGITEAGAHSVHVTRNRPGARPVQSEVSSAQGRSDNPNSVEVSPRARRLLRVRT